jgi:hypothetical protein
MAAAFFGQMLALAASIQARNRLKWEEKRSRHKPNHTITMRCISVTQSLSYLRQGRVALCFAALSRGVETPDHRRTQLHLAPIR